MPLRYTKKSMKIIEQILNFVFPPRPSEALIQKAAMNQISLNKAEGRFENIKYLTKYENPLVCAAIRENKYFNNSKATRLLGEVLKNSLLQLKGEVIIIPVPLSKERFRERGYNQVETIARYTGSLVKTDILERSVHTVPQTSLNKASRLKNVAGAYICKKPEEVNKLENTTIILLDDVVTTGATLNAARASLAPHLHPTSKLICLAIAH